MKKLLIIVPCYNCAPQAVRVASSIDELVSSYHSPHHAIAKVIFIDNHSVDSTVQDLLKLVPRLKNAPLFMVAKNQSNLGLGGSHKALFSYALNNGYDFVAVVHGDNQANALELAGMIEVSRTNGDATVLGSRFMNNSQLINYSLHRIVGNTVLNGVYSLILGRRISDLGSGLNLFNMSHLKDQNFFHFDDQFTFNMDVVIHLSSRSTNFVFHPISWKSEDEVSNAPSFKVGWRALMKILKWRLKPRFIARQNSSIDTYIFSKVANG